MKTKSKALALVGIAIVLCSLLLVALPGIAAEQNQTIGEVSASTSAITTTASEDDDTFTLDIYGNANEDDTIDMRDTTYIKLAIFGKKPKTNLSDANNDGKVSMLDVGQTKLIILGKEKSITVREGEGEVVTIPKPIKRVVTEHWSIDESMRIIGAADLIVGVNQRTKDQQFYFPELSKLPSIGMRPVDYEAILNLRPDVFLRRYGVREAAEKLPGITVFSLRMSHPNGIYDITSTGEEIDGNYVIRLRKLGYILDKREEAEEYIEWYEGVEGKIRERTTEGLSDDEKLVVLFSNGEITWGGSVKLTVNLGTAQMVRMAGVKILGEDFGTGTATVDTEWVIEQNPDVIVTSQVEFPSCGYGIDDTSAMEAAVQEILNNPALATVDAVKNKRVYMVCNPCFSYSPAHIAGAAYLAKVFYPDLVEDMDPKAIHQEYLDFQGLDFIDVDEHGVFVYPL